MTKESEIRNQIKNLIKDYFSQGKKEEFTLGKTTIPLVTPSYGWEEVCEVLDSLLDARLTMGEKVKQFEAAFAEYIGTKAGLGIGQATLNSGQGSELLLSTGGGSGSGR